MPIKANKKHFEKPRASASTVHLYLHPKMIKKTFHTSFYLKSLSVHGWKERKQNVVVGHWCVVLPLASKKKMKHLWGLQKKLNPEQKLKTKFQPRQNSRHRPKQTKTKITRDIIWTSQNLGTMTQHYWLNISKITENNVTGKIQKESVPMFQRCFVNSV